MITFKQKNYVIPEEERFVKPRPFPIPDEWKQYEFRMEIVELSSYKEKSTLGQDLCGKNGELILNVLEKKSKKNTFTMMTQKAEFHLIHIIIRQRVRKGEDIKSINGTDRLMYDIYNPRLTKDPETEEMYILQLITLNFCIGHTHRNGKKFSEK